MRPAPIELPDWIHDLPVAVWVTDSSMTLRYVNDTARRLLQHPRPVGCRCFDIVCGRSGGGRPFCRPDCPAAAAVREACAMRAVDLDVGGKASTRVRLFVAPLDGASPTRPLIHLAVEMPRQQHAERFVARVAERTSRSSAKRLAALSDREREILKLLAQDMTPRAVAEELSISYATVRNHIQHALSKMDAHSTLEAIACWVLSQPSRDKPGGPT